MYTAERTIDEAELESLVNRLVDDLGAAMSAALVVIGDRLGLYRAMRDGEPVTPERLALRTQTDARYVREWLSNQVAGGYVGYVGYDPDRDMFFLTPEQSLALAQDGSPAFIPGAFQCASAMVKATDRVASAFEHGHGIGWHESEQAGVDDRVTFKVACATEYARRETVGYDLVTMFDSLHYMGDPVGDCRPRPRNHGGGRHLDARRAECRRPAPGQPQSGRPHVLRHVDHGLHPPPPVRRT